MLALLLAGVLHCIPDSEDPAGIVRRLLAGLAPGSYLVLAHPASDIHTEQIGVAATRFNQLAEQGVTLRSGTPCGASCTAWTWSSRVWCSCTAGGPGPAARNPATTWPTTARSAASPGCAGWLAAPGGGRPRSITTAPSSMAVWNSAVSLPSSRQIDDGQRLAGEDRVAEPAGHGANRAGSEPHSACSRARPVKP